jgi:UDP-N-acetylglucosamine--N-acetylmuramyl-(pentapeptide) pyrophosphoryl-undecaprenol N-acetylglucosamine transferase
MESYKEIVSQVQVVEFIDSVEDAYRWADVLICRSGALTVSELTVAGLAAIYIPFPYAIDDHQTTNAMYVVKNGGGKVIQERDLNKDTLASALMPWYEQPVQLEEASKKSREQAKLGACEKIADECEALFA